MLLHNALNYIVQINMNHRVHIDPTEGYGVNIAFSEGYSYVNFKYIYQPYRLPVGVLQISQI